jgi:hypothetical protein
MIRNTVLMVVAWTCFALTLGSCYRMEDIGFLVAPGDDSTDGDTDTDIDSDVDGDSDIDSDTDTDTDTDGDSDTDSDSNTDTETETETGGDSDSDVDTDTGSATDTGSDLDCPELNPGDIFVTTPSSSEPDKFIMNSDMEVMYFPDYTAVGADDTVFLTWRETAEGLPFVSEDCLDTLTFSPDYPAGVNPRPGSYVIRQPDSDQLYVTLPDNTRAEITPEAAATLYGTPAFEGGADDSFQTVPDAFWPNLVNTAPDITEAMVHPGMIFKAEGDDAIYYADLDGTIREITAIGFGMNHFQLRFVRLVPASAVEGLSLGTSINGLVPAIADPTQGG